MPTPLVAVQVGAVSFVDEGVAPVLDVLQERGGANALFLATPTWTRGTGGRKVRRRLGSPGAAVLLQQS